jgi:hypothetical protein
MQNPCQRYVKGLKRVFQYLDHHWNLGIRYSKDDMDFEPVCYVDADFACDKDEYKSMMGYVFMLAGGPVEWKSIKQRIRALSTIEAEYVAGSTAAQEAVWIRRFLGEIGIKKIKPISFRCDSKSAIEWTKNPVQHHRTKHIGVKYHFIRQACTEGEISISHMPTEDNIADGFTKPLTGQKFIRFVKGLGLQHIAAEADD